jgi:hypothetical protein
MYVSMFICKECVCMYIFSLIMKNKKDPSEGCIPVYVCIYIIYICIYVCVCVYLCIWTEFVCMCVCMYVCACVCMLKHERSEECICMYVYGTFIHNVCI